MMILAYIFAWCLEICAFYLFITTGSMTWSVLSFVGAQLLLGLAIEYYIESRKH